jgi:lysophospholipid acyltransferase (LPLAT)-like uncharacterized protein
LKHWSLPSWDRTQIPKPFTRVALVVGAPIEVETAASDGMLESRRREVEQALLRLENRAREMLK